jgi:hypothetical protein
MDGACARVCPPQPATSRRPMVWERRNDQEKHTRGQGVFVKYLMMRPCFGATTTTTGHCGRVRAHVYPCVCIHVCVEYTRAHQQNDIGCRFLRFSFFDGTHRVSVCVCVIFRVSCFSNVAGRVDMERGTGVGGGRGREAGKRACKAKGHVSTEAWDGQIFHLRQYCNS